MHIVQLATKQSETAIFCFRVYPYDIIYVVFTLVQAVWPICCVTYWYFLMTCASFGIVVWTTTKRPPLLLPLVGRERIYYNAFVNWFSLLNRFGCSFTYCPTISMRAKFPDESHETAAQARLYWNGRRPMRVILAWLVYDSRACIFKELALFPIWPTERTSTTRTPQPRSQGLRITRKEAVSRKYNPTLRNERIKTTTFTRHGRGPATLMWLTRGNKKCLRVCKTVFHECRSYWVLLWSQVGIRWRLTRSIFNALQDIYTVLSDRLGAEGRERRPG